MAQVEQRPGGGDLARGSWRTVRDYIAITKPRIIELLLVTAIPTMILAARGWPDPVTALAVIVGGMLAAGGANAYNSVYDRDIDAVMARTHSRPVATGAVSARGGLVLATLLSLASVVILAVFANALAAVPCVTVCTWLILSTTSSAVPAWDTSNFAVLPAATTCAAADCTAGSNKTPSLDAACWIRSNTAVVVANSTGCPPVIVVANDPSTAAETDAPSPPPALNSEAICTRES